MNTSTHRPVSLAGWVHMSSGKIWVRCILSSGKILVRCISVLRVSDQPNGFRAPFPGLFRFLVKIKKLNTFIT